MREVFDMARESGFTEGEFAFMGDNFRRFAELVRADEREACAKVADLVASEIDDTNGTATYIAAAIRNRGNT
jgi:hypothetical protein